MTPTGSEIPDVSDGVRHWLGVVCRDHVHRGVSLGIAQLGHGKRDGLARLRPGDWLIYYSPRTSLHNGEVLQRFTAIGEVADPEIWRADEGSFTPWRRRIRYAQALSVAIRDVPLELTAQPNWGYQLRRGLIALSEHDFHAIKAAMGA